MSVSRHPDPWIDKGFEGKYLNVETKQYSDTHSEKNSDGTIKKDKNGLNVPSKDNSFAYPTPFIKLNDDGTAVDGTTQIQDVSGEAYVQRVQGNQYSYAEGSAFSYGSTCDFNFGNGYEENHGWANSQVPFDSSNLNPPYTERFVIPTLGANNEKEQGLVSKSWGNEYNFSFGTSRNWSAGPVNQLIDDNGKVTTDSSASAALKSGKFCEYSYGTGYEEVLIDQNDGDADQHYSSTKHNDWKAGNLPGWPSDPGSLLVSKVFGKTFDYRHGDAYEVREGNAEEKVCGNSYSTVHGDSHEWVGEDGSKSNSYSTVYGDSTETVHGDSTANVYGHSMETFWGRKDEFFMGGSNSMSLAAMDEIALAAKFEMFAGGVVSIALGAILEITGAFKVEIEMGGRAEVNMAADLNSTVGAKIETALTKVETGITNVCTAIANLFV
ncbi:MAG TPA: hypothetical protein VFM15_06285 [Gammaproteobacteria bacterium]|nr:hypothetical protein [Gammaproteobacteria bacterium]